MSKVDVSSMYGTMWNNIDSEKRGYQMEKNESVKAKDMIEITRLYDVDIEKGIEIGDWYVVDRTSSTGCPIVELGEDMVVFIDGQYEIIGIYLNPVESVSQDRMEAFEELESDNVNHPEHYNNSGMETIDKMEFFYGTKALKIYCTINAYKYDARAGLKDNAEEDGQKATWYINKAKELQEKMDNGESILGSLDYILEY